MEFSIAAHFCFPKLSGMQRAAAREAVYLQDVSEFVGIKQPGAIKIDEDNAGCLKWTDSLGNHSKRKHIDLYSYNAYDSVQAGICAFVTMTGAAPTH